MQFHSFEAPRHRVLIGNPGESIQVGRFSPDGRWFAARDGQQLCIWDSRTDSPAAVLPVASRTTFFFSPQDSELFAIPYEPDRQGSSGRWHITANTNAGLAPIVQSLPVQTPRGVTRAAAVPNALVMTSAEGVHFVALTNFSSGDFRTVPIPPGLGYVSPDGQWLAMQYDYSPIVGVYHLPEVTEVARLQTSNLVGFITFSPNGDEMLVLNRSGAEWFETTSWKRTRREAGTGVSGSYAFYTPDGKGLWLVNHFRKAALHDRRTLQPILPLPTDVLPLAVSPDGRQLAVSVEGRRIQLWDLQQFRAELAGLGLDW
jgi:WD40 repeat protein